MNSYIYTGHIYFDNEDGYPIVDKLGTMLNIPQL